MNEQQINHSFLYLFRSLAYLWFPGGFIIIIIIIVFRKLKKYLFRYYDMLTRILSFGFMLCNIKPLVVSIIWFWEKLSHSCLIYIRNWCISILFYLNLFLSKQLVSQKQCWLFFIYIYFIIDGSNITNNANVKA